MDKKELIKQDNNIISQPQIQTQTQIQIFGATTPQSQIQKAVEIANAVSRVIEEKRLYAIIQNKKYVMCEGWTTMGALLGLFPQIVAVKEENERYIAICEIRTLDGRLVSRAEAECSQMERNKIGQDKYAIRSMAQTRAVSKAFRIALSWIMVLAGYQPTPAEEINGIIEIEAEKNTRKTQKQTKPQTQKKQTNVMNNHNNNNNANNSNDDEITKLIDELDKLRLAKGYENDTKFEQKFGLSVKAIRKRFVPARILREKIEQLKEL